MINNYEKYGFKYDMDLKNDIRYHTKKGIINNKIQQKIHLYFSISLKTFKK